MTRVLAESNHLHHPRYVGHQVTAPLPSSALVHLASALLNNGTAVYEMGPVSAPLERRGARLDGAAGGPPRGRGRRPHLGRLGREPHRAPRRAAGRHRPRRVGGGARRREATGHPRPGRDPLLREAGGADPRARKGGIFSIPVDERFRLRPEALPETLRVAERSGRQVSPWWPAPARPPPGPSIPSSRSPSSAVSTASGSTWTARTAPRRCSPRSTRHLAQGSAGRTRWSGTRTR